MSTVLPAGSVVGELSAPWRGKPVPVVTSRAPAGLVLSGTSIALRSYTCRLPGGAFCRGEQIGTLSTGDVTGTRSTSLVVGQPTAGPSIVRRLSRL
jgi:hypothetical protein